MANRKTPGRDAFKVELQKIEGDIPTAYSARILEILQKNGYAVKLKALLAMRGRDNKEGLFVYFNNVRKGHTVDWDVLAAFQQLAKQVKKSNAQELVTA